MVTPEKGEILLTSGLFDPVFQKKPVEFIETVKVKGQPLQWKVRLFEPLFDIEYMTQTPICFFWLGEKELSDEIKETLTELNENREQQNPQMKCCDKYDTAFCPECGEKL